MSYTTTITFPVETIKTGDTLQLIIEFTHDGTGSNRVWDAYDYGMKVTKWDKLEMSYDIEDALMVPASFSLELSDSDGELDGLFFGDSTVNIAADKQAKVTIKHNGTAIFSGHIIEDTIFSNPHIEKIKFKAAPKTDMINKRMVFGESNETLWATANSYVSTSKLKLIDELLLHIYQLANSSLTAGDIDVFHDWEFKGAVVLDTGQQYFFEAIGFDIENVKQSATPIFFSNIFGLSNCGDVLRKIAVDYCAFTGMLSLDRPFFKKMFSYDASNLQTVTVLKHEKGYRYGLIDYVKCTTHYDHVDEPYEAGTFTQLEDRYLTRKIIPAFKPYPLDETIDNSSSVPLFHSKSLWNFICSSGTTAPTEGAVYSNNGSQFTVAAIDDLGGQWHVFTERTSGTNNPNNSSLTKVSGTGDSSISITSNSNITDELYAVKVRDSIVNSGDWTVIGDLTAKYWYNYRGNIQNCRVDEFLFYGVGYDFLKDFNYDNSKFQPIGMKINWSECTTECEAIYIGSLYGPELIINGDLELDSNWSDYGTPTTNERSAVQKQSGSYSRHVVCDGASEGIISDYFSVVAGVNYRIQVWVYVVSGSVSITRTHARLDWTTLVSSGTGSWQLLETTMVASATGGEQIRIRSAFGAAEFYVDDVSIREIL